MFAVSFVPRSPRSFRGVSLSAALVVLLSSSAGCQVGQTVQPAKLIQQRTLLDFSGLKPAEEVHDLQVSVSIPYRWTPLGRTKNPLFTHDQWRSPSETTGVGVVYVHLPLPLSARTLVWLAKQEYVNKRDDGRLIAEWTDALGRPWFEAENNRFHLTGYAVTKGFDAWIIYCGYKIARPMSPGEMGLAGRCLQSIVPLPLVPEEHRSKMNLNVPPQTAKEEGAKDTQNKRAG